MTKKESKVKAAKLIQWYREGSDLDDEQLYILNDAAREHGQILDNIVHMLWFRDAVAENLKALEDCL